MHVKVVLKDAWDSATALRTALQLPFLGDMEPFMYRVAEK